MANIWSEDDRTMTFSCLIFSPAPYHAPVIVVAGTQLVLSIRLYLRDVREAADSVRYALIINGMYMYYGVWSI